MTNNSTPSKATDRLRLLTELAAKADADTLRRVRKVQLTWTCVEEYDGSNQMFPNVTIEFKE